MTTIGTSLLVRSSLNPFSVLQTVISSTVRLAEWILAEYRNQNSPATFYTVGLESGGGPVITSLSPASGPAGALVTITGSNFGAGQAAVL